MKSLVAGSVRRSRNVLAFAVVFGLMASSLAMAQTGAVVPLPGSPIPPPPLMNGTAGAGSLGYGRPGAQPGWQGFGLSYHLGYGYGGDALGTGAEGGYPFYGGPGYPHPEPELKRLSHTEMFAYFGGPGYPTASCPNFFGMVGPLKADAPVITIGGDAGYDSGYGAFTGTLPYLEATFAPYTTAAAGGGAASGGVTSGVGPSSSYSSNAMAQAAPISAGPAAPGRSLGLEMEQGADAMGQTGLKILRVYEGSVAAQAGIRIGDVIHSINGYETLVQGNLAWIVAYAAPGKVLVMNVRAATDGKISVYRVQLP